MTKSKKNREIHISLSDVKYSFQNKALSDSKDNTKSIKGNNS